MLEVTLEVGLTLKGPILTKSTAAGIHGIDSPVARNSEGKCYLPGTLVKGRLRQAMEEIIAVGGTEFSPHIDDWLGTCSSGDDIRYGTVKPSRGQLHFKDFIDQNEKPSKTLYRIQIDEQRGAVAKGAYQAIEAPYTSGELYHFTGSVHYFAANHQEADDIKRYIEIGLCWITSLGAERTIGFGILTDVAVTETRQALCSVAHSSVAHSTETDPLALEYSLKPLAPFCIARRRVDNNLFESEAEIPGGVLKGCITTSWRTCLGLKSDGEVDVGMDPMRPELCKYFEKMRFTHAFPALTSNAKRPIFAPLSLVKYEREDETTAICDVALCDGPGLLGDKPAAPSFSVDWKSADGVRYDFGWPKLRRELRVRTSIDKQHRRALEEHLFAYEMIDPGDAFWYGRVDLSQISDAQDRIKVEAQLRDILRQGVWGLGKTKCQANVMLYSQGTVQPVCISNPAPRDGLWVVTLQTPALLCDPRLLAETSGRSELSHSYAEGWKQISGNSLQLIRFFARQSLAGGFYLYRRFQYGNVYNPYLLTEPGSVFVLQAETGRSGDAESCIREWLTVGLPLPDWAIERYKRGGQPGDHWENCPYLRSNGYGEIAVNLNVHWDKRPHEGEFHAI